jgi:hypothetical protein
MGEADNGRSRQWAKQTMGIERPGRAEPPERQFMQPDDPGRPKWLGKRLHTLFRIGRVLEIESSSSTARPFDPYGCPNHRHRPKRACSSESASDVASHFANSEWLHRV